MYSQAKYIEPFDDIKGEILKRRFDLGLNDIQEGHVYTSEEVFEQIKEKKEQSEPAIWNNIKQA